MEGLWGAYLMLGSLAAIVALMIFWPFKRKKKAP